MLQAGFPHQDLSWLEGLIAVKSPLADLMHLFDDSQSTDEFLDCIAFQPQGSDYTLIFYVEFGSEIAQALSARLATRVVYLWDEDVSGWIEYSVYENGKEAECFLFGFNYEEEMSTADESHEPRPIEEKAQGWDTFATDGDSDFFFRSSLARCDAEAIKNGLTFIDQRFKELDVSVPPRLDADQHRECILLPSPSRT